MKKIILVALLCSMTSLTFAQQLTVGIAGAFNSTWLFNEEDSDAGDELDYASTFGGDFGILGEYMFNDKIGIGVDVMLSSNNQNYDLQDPMGNSSEATQKLSTIDIPVTFKIVSPGGAYFELGPTFSFISSAEAELPSGTVDNKDMLAGSNIEGTIGFGVDLPISDVLFLATGLRFNWGFSDIADGNRNDPTNTASGGLRLAVKYVLPTK